MSKAKKVISALLAIIVLVGVGFGAYLLFRKKDNKLTEDRAIKLVSEASTKLNSAIKTMGSGLAADTGTQTASGIQTLNSSANISASGTANMEDYVEFLDELTQAGSFLEMVNYALNLGNENSIKFDKTYAGYIGRETSYMTIYRTDSVVFEYGIKESHDDDHVLANTYGVIDYNKDKDEPSAFNFFVVIEEDYKEDEETSYSFSVTMHSIDFESKMFNCYAAYMYDLPNASLVDTFRNKLSKGTLKANDIKDYIDFASGDDFFAYTGNIANRIDDISMASHNTVGAKEDFFNKYSSNVKNLDIIASSKLDYDNAINLTKVSNDIFATKAASRERYNYFVSESNGKFYFISVDDYKQFDSVITNALKGRVATLTNADADGEWHNSVRISVSNNEYVSESFNLVKNVVNALEEYYQNHKDDANYVSILLGKCGIELSLPSASANVSAYITVEEESFVYEITYNSLVNTDYDGYLSLRLGDGQ